MALKLMVVMKHMKLVGKLSAFVLLEHLVNLLIVSLCMIIIVNILHLSKYAIHYQGKLAELNFADACILIDELVNVSEVSQRKNIIFKPICKNDSGYLLNNEYQINFYDKKHILRIQSSDRKGHMPLLLDVKQGTLNIENKSTLCLTTILKNKNTKFIFIRNI